MRVAALYDIHGNLPALEAVLAEVELRGVDQVVVGGDVALGPMPRACIDRLRGLDLPTKFIRGNCDRELLAFRRGEESAAVPEATRTALRWCAQQLRDDDEELMRSWPLTVRLSSISCGEVVFCHATPRDDNEIFTRLTADERLLPILREANSSLVVCGHTHMQFDRMVGPIRAVNAGSIGMPFGGTGAYWLLLDREVELRRTAYDLASAAAQIRATAYPAADEFARLYVEASPAEDKMLEAYQRAPLNAPA